MIALVWTGALLYAFSSVLRKCDVLVCAFGREVQNNIIQALRNLSGTCTGSILMVHYLRMIPALLCTQWIGCC